MLLGDVHRAHFHPAAHLLNLPSVFRALIDGIEQVFVNQIYMSSCMSCSFGKWSRVFLVERCYDQV